MLKKILQIDDEPGVLAALTVRLRAAGFEVIAASDGLAGLNAAREHLPQVILLDIRMPGIDGFEVCRRLKATPELADIPVIFLTANSSDEDRQTAAQVGGAGFLVKPYYAPELMAMIQHVQSRRRIDEQDANIDR